MHQKLLKIKNAITCSYEIWRDKQHLAFYETKIRNLMHKSSKLITTLG